MSLIRSLLLIFRYFEKSWCFRWGLVGLRLVLVLYIGIIALLVDKSSSMNFSSVKHATSGQTCLRSAKPTESTHTHTSLHDAKICTCFSLSHQVLCQFDIDGWGWIHKKSLRELSSPMPFPCDLMSLISFG